MKPNTFETIVLLTLLMTSGLVRAGASFKETLNIGEDASPSTYHYSGVALTKGITLRVKFSSLIKAPKVGEAYFDCNEPVNVKLPDGQKKSGSKFNFSLYKRTTSTLNLKLTLNSDNAVCDLRVNVVRQNPQQFTISPFKALLPSFETPEDGTEEGAVLLDSGVEAIRKRLQILTGKNFTTKQILDRDPQMPLDISEAPKYDFILFSTLHFNNDFISNVMFRSLVLHAQRGTPVLIVATSILVGAKEQALVDWALAQSPNIKFLAYSYARESGSINERIDHIQRVTHIKVFLTYSKDHPELNHIIAGGRNNSDRYFFPKKIDLAGDQYTQFDKGLMDKWAFFNDLEFYLRSPSDVVSIIKKMLNFAKIQTSTEVSEKQEGDFSFFVSIPYEDGMALEAQYVDLINRAQKSIRIFTPYIYLTDKIKQALQDANDREVQVTIITSQYLIGDAMTAALKRAYDRFVYDNNRYINVFHFVADKAVVLHKKAILIDEDVLVLGSVNLSQRSFVHDTELSVNIQSHEMIQDFIKLFNSYKANSVPYEEKKKEAFVRDVARLLKVEHMF